MAVRTDDIAFERLSPAAKVAKKILINPLANYLPAGMLRGWLKRNQSELALSNWRDPGGWRSMVISYEGNPERSIDRMLVKTGSIPMALRNRRKLAGRLFTAMIDEAPGQPPHVLCLGAGPGLTVMDALQQTQRQDAEATLVDLSSDAFDYGRSQAEKRGVADRMRYIQGDVRDVQTMLDRPVDLVTMIGICEYLEDGQITDIVRSAAEVMQPGAAIVFNSISRRHGTDRFFRRVFGLHMNHRTPKAIQALLEPAGFGDFEVFPEPMGVYHVVVGRKVTPAENATKQEA